MDDALLLTRNARDAERVMEVLPKRFVRYNLNLHPDKTCVTVFKPGEKSSIDFLGFTHYWRKSRRGRWSIHRKTMKPRFAQSVKAIGHGAGPIGSGHFQSNMLPCASRYRGLYAYFGIRGNSDATSRSRYVVEYVWIKSPRRQSHRHRLDGERAVRLLRRYLLPLARLITI